MSNTHPPLYCGSCGFGLDTDEEPCPICGSVQSGIVVIAGTRIPSLAPNATYYAGLALFDNELQDVRCDVRDGSPEEHVLGVLSALAAARAAATCAENNFGLGQGQAKALRMLLDSAIEVGDLWLGSLYADEDAE